MLKTRRLFGALTLLPLALAAWPAAAAAQQPVDANTVGAPQLRDFTLPGTRTTPPAQVPPPAATPVPRAAPPATTGAPARRAPPASSRPARPAPQREPTPPRTTSAPAPRPAPVQAAPQAAPTIQPQPQPQAAAPVQPQPQAVTPPPAAVPAPQPDQAPVQQSGSGFPWLWLVGALVLLAGGAFLLLRRRRAAIESDARDRGSLAGSLATAQWLPAEEPAPRPVPAAPEPAPAAAPAKRAVLEVDIRPERASVMADGMLAHYSLTLTNTGEAAAGNIRIDGRMFNASADGEVDAFFAGPIHEVSGSPNVFIQPGESMTLQGQIGMTSEEQQGIEVQGRVIFVPLVAMNVAYEWEGGSGRTSTSWLVGRTPSTPEAKMGAFRLDLGPRIYRQVDRREAKKALV